MITLQFVCVVIAIVTLKDASAVENYNIYEKNLGLDERSEIQERGIMNKIRNFICPKEKRLFKKLLKEIRKVSTELKSVSTEIKDIKQSLKKAEVPIEYRPAYPVFMATSTKGRYHLSLQQAKEICKQKGGKLAAYAQLRKAWEQGMDSCNCGWIAQGYAVYPIQYPRSGCHPSKGPGIRKGCSWRKTWNAWCFSHRKASKVARRDLGEMMTNYADIF